MKINFKNIILATLSVAIMAGVTVFTACSKDDPTNNEKTTSVLATSIENPENPYDFMGARHNAGLDYIANTRDMASLTDADIYEAVVEFTGDNSLTYEEIQNHVSQTQENVASMLTGDISPENLVGEGMLANIMSDVNQMYTDMLNSNTLLKPEVFAGTICILEQKVLEFGYHHAPSEDKEMNEYDAVLSMLAITRYSYAYWYNVSNDLDNPWNKKISTKALPGWLKAVCDFFVETAEVVIKAVFTVPVDAWCGLCKDCNGFKINISLAIQGSCKMWKNNWW